MSRELFGILLLILLTATQLLSQKDEERSVQVYATYDTTEQMLTLNWKPSPNALTYRVSRWENNNWIIKGTTDQNETTFSFDDHDIGEIHEYRVEAIGGLGGTGYIYTGFEVMPPPDEKRCLLVVDSILMASLPFEIHRWEEDVRGDGWQVTTTVCRNSESVVEVKRKIIEWYNADPFAEVTVFILGNIAVPYSGEINPDAHNNHIGAWPCDAFYGDIQDFVWTDNRVNNISASDPRNHNVPGDGKFDQSTMPSLIEIEVGRVDLFDLPAFPDDYIELSRQYLEKNHVFRTGGMDVPRRALVENNFASFDEGFGQNGFKNFAPMVGPENVFRGDYENDLENESYLLAYACGGGSYTSMGGVGNTTSLYVDRDIQAVFVMNFGSYFGDWDKSNNLLRASLASGNILTNAWAGRPNWAFHHMALGKHAGYSTTLTQNNTFRYTPGFFGGFAHVSLLGDPTLRLHPVKPPGDLQISEINGEIELEWTTSPDAEEGYLVYRSSENEPDEQLTEMPIQTNTYTDPCVSQGEMYRYMVKSVRLEESASGSYYNTSIGIADTITPVDGALPVASFEWNANYESVVFTAEAINADSLAWDFGTGDVSGDTNPEYLFPSAGVWVVCMEAFNGCGASTYCDTLSVESSLPEEYSVKASDVACHGGNNGSLTFIHSSSPRLSYDWSSGSTDSVASGLSAGYYSLRIISLTGLELTLDSLEVAQPDLLVADITTTPSSGNNGTASAIIMGGTPPYELTWGDGSIDPDMLAPGTYILTVKDSNDCEIETTFEVDVRTSVLLHEDRVVEIYPNPSVGEINVTLLDDDWKLKGITDPSGAMIQGWSQRLTSEGILIDIGKLVPGNYWLVFDKGESPIYVPFIRI